MSLKKELGDLTPVHVDESLERMDASMRDGTTSTEEVLRMVTVLQTNYAGLLQIIRKMDKYDIGVQDGNDSIEAAKHRTRGAILFAAILIEAAESTEFAADFTDPTESGV